MQTNLPVRKSIRLKHYDYSQNGAYFITVCVNKHDCILSVIRRGDPCGRPQSELTELGELCGQAFITIENTYAVEIDKYVVMPNHVHFIMLLPGESHWAKDERRATARVAPTVGRVVGGYKSSVAAQWLRVCKSNDIFMGKIWQRNYSEHIIRDEEDYQTKWRYYR